MGNKARLKTSILSGLFPVYRLFGFLLTVSCLSPLPAEAQAGPSVVPLCDVVRSPDKFDRQVIRVRGNVHLAFEDFTLHPTACPDKWPAIWLAFGGDVPTPTISTANDTVRPQGVTPKFGGVSVSLTKDENFERFFALISARSGNDSLYHVTATLTGIFLAGRNVKGWPPGYGHLGAFHLFVISRVDAVNAHPSPQLNTEGVITDAAGTPVAGVDVYSQTVNCCQPRVKQTRSDGTGHFALGNAGQVLSLVKVGYSPQNLVLERGRTDLHIILDRSSEEGWKIPNCTKNADKGQFSGLPLSVSIPEDLHSEQLSSAPNSPFIIHHKVGYPYIRLFKADPSAPYSQMASHVFSSGKFSQRNALNEEGQTIGMDAKGARDDKIFWRVLALSGQEIVEYYVASRETADLFDGIIDSACVQTR
jgi:hypothetical protein